MTSIWTFRFEFLGWIHLASYCTCLALPYQADAQSEAVQPKDQSSLGKRGNQIVAMQAAFKAIDPQTDPMIP